LRLAIRYLPAPAEAVASLGAVAAILALGWATLRLYGALLGGGPLVVDPEVTPFFGPQQVSAYFSRIVPLYDARGQSLAHLVMVLAIAVVVLTVRLSRPDLTGLRLRAPRGGLAVVLVLLGGASLYFGTTHRPAVYVAGLILLLLCLTGVPVRRGGGNLALAVLTMLALATATLPGFWLRPDLSHLTWWEVCFSQAHYALVIAPADLLAAGRVLLRDVQPVYGLVLPVLVGAGERALGPLSLGGYVHLLQGLQAIYLFLATFLFWRHARGRWLLVLLALAMVFPWYHFNHRALFFPNQTPWRTIAVPLAAVAVGLMRHRTRGAAALVLGGVSGGALLLNHESGLAVTAGSLAYLGFRYRLATGSLPRADLIRVIALFSAGLVGSWALFAIATRIALGYWLGVSALPELWQTIVLTSAGGFDGRPLTNDPWPVLMFAHAAFVLVNAALKRESGFASSFRTFVAATLVVWFAYYANRPHPWNLSSFYLLYGFLFIDSLRFVISNLRGRRRADDLVVATLGALVLIVLPNLSHMAAKGAGQVAEGLRTVWGKDRPSGGRLVSGVYLPETGASELLQKADFIRSRLPWGPPVFLTSDSYLVPKLAGAFSSLPVVDACWETTNRKDYDRLLGALTGSGHEFIYLDAPGTLAHDNTTCWEFYARVRLDLEPRFEKSGVEQGWEVWRRRGHS
jgi:hypothetical protein